MIYSAEDFLTKLKRAKLTMKEVCKEAVVTEKTASKWACGRCGTRITTIAKLNEAYIRLMEEKLRAKKK